MLRGYHLDCRDCRFDLRFACLKVREDCGVIDLFRTHCYTTFCWKKTEVLCYSGTEENCWEQRLAESSPPPDSRLGSFLNPSPFRGVQTSSHINHFLSGRKPLPRF